MIAYTIVSYRHHRKEYNARPFNPFAVSLSPINSPLTTSTGVPPGVSSESGSGRPLDMFPLLGEAADGGDVLPFPFPFGSEEGLIYVQVSRWKRGASN